ncbi:MAG: hypothetical protein AOA66_0129 [Candidatus Bathyarchaeota archaeon BA2]|nr:MAG: hypothetical protein AOA66_0129 [Candidatus Bathyarchaeota archaeon BA2]
MVDIREVWLSKYGDDVIVSYKAERGKKTELTSEVIVLMKDGRRLSKSLDVDLMKWQNGTPITWKDWEREIGYTKWYKFGIGSLVGKIKEIIIRIDNRKIHFIPSGDEKSFKRI